MKHTRIDETNERLAREFYAVYGAEYYGDQMIRPTEYFEIEAFARSANAYRAAVAAIVPPGSYAMEADPREPGIVPRA